MFWKNLWLCGPWGLTGQERLLWSGVGIVCLEMAAGWWEDRVQRELKGGPVQEYYERVQGSR